VAPSPVNGQGERQDGILGDAADGQLTRCLIGAVALGREAGGPQRSPGGKCFTSNQSACGSAVSRWSIACARAAKVDDDLGVACLRVGWIESDLGGPFAELPLNGAPVWVPENPKWLLSACTVQSAAMAGVARSSAVRNAKRNIVEILQEILRHTGSIRFMMPSRRMK